MRPAQDTSGETPPHSPPPEVGDYLVRELIAAGSFGAVFRAEHAERGEPAAIKIMHAALSANGEAVARFEQEIAVMQRVEHPAVLTVLDQGRLDDGRPYLVTELLVGESLQAHLETRGRLDPGEVLAILGPICGALAATHARGIVHRDVKPSNVFLAGRRVVLLDFGVAKLLDVGDALTITGDLVGTLACMSPEQILSRPVDPRTDVYALGVLAYRMLAGSPPFAAKNPIGLQQQHLYAAPRPPSAVAPIDPALDAPVLRALAKEPAARSPSVEAFLDELAGAAGPLSPSESSFAPTERQLVRPPEWRRDGLAPGEVVHHRFEIERLVSEGGMGAVYRARDREDGRIVALKLLQGRSSPEQEQRFAREAQALASLSHPAIVRYVTHGWTESGERFLAMEWIEGEDLGERLARGKLTASDCVLLGMRVAEALGEAHGRGIVHRDIKPHNLFLPSGRPELVKVVDFGIARWALESHAVTRTDVFVGTPSYAAPEQARGAKSVDVRADVFSLGCVLFECLAGHPPFSSDHVMGVLAKILFEDAPSLLDVEGVPPALAELVGRMLSKDPDSRPADGTAVAAELSGLDGGALVRQASEAPRAPALTRKEQQLVSVILVASGSDAGGELAETLSPEEVIAPFERLRALVAPLGARAERIANGAAMAALAGRGSATEQAAHAARCALALRAALPEVSIVLTTGRGVIGERLPVGEAIDRASALLRAVDEQRSAATRPGGGPIRIDDVTAELIAPQFNIGGERGAGELMGEREPDEGVRTLLGKPTPCVGRQSDLAMLEEMWHVCTEEPVAQAVVVTAAPGIGKSRLCHEFLARVRRKESAAEIAPNVCIARGDPLRAGSSFGMVGQILRRAAGLLGGEPLPARREKLRARVAQHVPPAEAPRVAEFLGELVETPFPDEDSVKLRAARRDRLLMGDQMKAAWKDFLSAECEARPTLLVLEDLHWGDLASVQLVEAALSALRERPIMALGLARPEVHDLFPKLWLRHGAQHLRLRTLSQKASEQLVSDVLGEDATAEEIARITKQAGGNALHLEELIRAVTEGKKETQPATVLAMMQARLETLEPEARHVMRIGSLFGEAFWAGAVAELLGGVEAPKDQSARLSALVQRELLVKRAESRFPGQDEYMFRHALVREAAYGTLTARDCAAGHRLSGRWLERMGEQDAMVLAEHFERGGERSRAAALYGRAAEQALHANDLASVLIHAERAVRCGAEGELLGLIRWLEGEVYYWKGPPSAAVAHFESAMQLLPPGTRTWFGAAGGLATSASLQDDPERLLVLVKVVSRTAPADPSTNASQVVVLANLARWLLRAGLRVAAESLSDQLEGAMQAMAHEPAVLAHLHTAFASRALFAGDMVAGRALFQMAVACFDQAGDVRNAVVRRMSAAAVLLELGDPAGSEAELQEVLGPAERLIGHRLAYVIRCRLSRALACRGALAEARALAEQAVTEITPGDRWYGSHARSCLALILMEMGDPRAAEVTAQQAIEASAATPRRCFALAVLGRARLLQGRPGEAREAAEEAACLLEQGGVEEGEALVRLVLAEAIHATGDIEAARVALAAGKRRLLDRAAKIEDPAVRRRFLENVPEHASTLELARQWEGSAG